MEDKFLVSIIIPVYNASDYLSEALESVCEQSYKNLEIILVDDGSTDGSEKICDSFAKEDHRIQVIHQKNRGLSNARNVGLERSNGDLIAFLDSDDSFDSCFIEIMLKAMISTEAELAICNYLIYDTTVKKRESIKEASKSADIKLYNREDTFRLLVEGVIDHSVWNRLYKRELWSGIRFPEGHVYEDMEISYRIVNETNTICLIDQALYFHRKRTGSISHTWSIKNYCDWILARSHVEAFICENVPIFFSNDQLQRYRHSWFNGMIRYYVLTMNNNADINTVEKKQLIEHVVHTCKKIGFQGLPTYSRIGYWLLCFCPEMLKTLYGFYVKRRRHSFFETLSKNE